MQAQRYIPVFTVAMNTNLRKVLEYLLIDIDIGAVRNTLYLACTLK